MLQNLADPTHSHTHTHAHTSTPSTFDRGRYHARGAGIVRVLRCLPRDDAQALTGIARVHHCRPRDDAKASLASRHFWMVRATKLVSSVLQCHFKSRPQ